MKQIIFTFFVVVSGLVAKAQTSQILGHWKFDRVYEVEELDSTSKAMVAMFFKDLAFEFNADKTCSLSMMGKKEAAKWSFKDIEKNTVEVYPEKGKSTIIETISLTQEEWIIHFATGNFVLRRLEE